MRKVILYIAASLDGYIAKPNDDMSFLSMVQKEGEDYGYGEFIRTVDTVILGRKTYDWVTKAVGFFPHADKSAYVITKTERPPIGQTIFYTGDLADLIKKLKSTPGSNIFCDGGAEIVHQFLQYDLIDEITLSIIPVLLGEGTRLFNDGRPEQKLELIGAKSFGTGLTQLHYRRAGQH